MRPKLIALLAVSALALVGCSAGEPSVEPTATVTVTATPEVSASPKIDHSEISAKPLTMSAEVAETTAITEVEQQKSKPYELQQEEFMSFINPEFSGWTGDLPPEKELLAAAKFVCNQLRDGIDQAEVEVIDGSIYKFTKEQDENLTNEQKTALRNTPHFDNNRRLVSAASSAFCLEYTY